MPRHSPMTPKEIVKKLREDGWILKRKGPGDHVQFVHPDKPGKVTVDMGVGKFPLAHFNRSIVKLVGLGYRINRHGLTGLCPHSR